MRFNSALSYHKKPTQAADPFTKMSSSLWILVLLSCLPSLCAGNPNRVTYETHGTRSYFGRDSCTENWCGEQWKSHRILYYNLTLNSSLVLKNVTTLNTVNICPPGAQNSGDCKETVSVESTELTSVRVNTLHRTTEEPIKTLTESPELDHHYLLSDNVQLTNEGPRVVSDLYPANQTKIWQIKIPRQCKMFVSFIKFSIESTDNCEKDYFSVQTSPDPNEVVVFCDSLQEIEIKRRRKVQFTLHSDHAEHKGQLAASVCLSKNETEDRTQCDCYESSRRRRSVPLTAHSKDNSLIKKRAEALQRLNQRSSS